MWVDLQEGILEDFAEVARAYLDSVTSRLGSTWSWRKENDSERAREYYAKNIKNSPERKAKIKERLRSCPDRLAKHINYHKSYRDGIKSSPELIAKHRAYQKEYQKARRARMAAEKSAGNS